MKEHLCWLLDEVVEMGWSMDLVEIGNFLDELLRKYNYPVVDWRKIQYLEDFSDILPESKIYIAAFKGSLLSC